MIDKIKKIDLNKVVGERTYNYPTSKIFLFDILKKKIEGNTVNIY